MSVLYWVIFLGLVSSCTTLPEPKFTKYSFPKNEAFVGDVKRPYKVLGMVKTKVDFPTLDPNRDELFLCRNYYNKAVEDLIKRAREKGGDAIVDVKSVVFLEDGRMEIYPTPECSDDGEEGQILAQGIAVKWLTEGAPSPTPLDDPSASLLSSPTAVESIQRTKPQRKPSRPRSPLDPTTLD